MSQHMYLALGVEMVMLMMIFAVVMSSVGVLTSPHNKLNCPPQLTLFYVVPSSVVYISLRCTHMKRL